LLRAASFLNTAAMCYRYVAAVLGNEAGGIRNKIGILRILRTLQIFVLPIMSPMVTFRSSPSNHK
jgi:ascorbate-specific PTS system EIIC-type component UlaA